MPNDTTTLELTDDEAVATGTPVRVTCENGHRTFFATRQQAEHWAEWGHACLTHQIVDVRVRFLVQYEVDGHAEPSMHLPVEAATLAGAVATAEHICGRLYSEQPWALTSVERTR